MGRTKHHTMTEQQPNFSDTNHPQPAAPETLPDPRQFQSLGEAVSAAKADARRLAGEAAPKLKDALRTVIYDVTYGAAFGACFAAAFAREVTPTTIKEGLARGARAGREAGAKAKSAFTPDPAAPADVVDVGAACPGTA